MTLVVAGCVLTFSAFHMKNAQAIHAVSKTTQRVSAEQRGRIRASLDALPLAFEANQGQTDAQVKYTARGNGYSVFLTGNDTVFAISSAEHAAGTAKRVTPAQPRPQTSAKIQSAAIDMHLVGGNPKPEVAAGNELPGVVNYYVGNDPKNWHTGVKEYSSVSYRDVYPGMNMIFHGAQRQLEFDFVVSPGADPKAIGLGFKGASKISTDDSGNLVLASSAGDVVLHKPVAYQEKDGNRQIVDAAFQIKDRNVVALNVGAYDRGRDLVIDPSLSYATYLGGSAEDEVFGIAVDAAGNAYVTGQMNSPTFPASGGTVPNVGNFDAFVTKISAGPSIGFTTVIAGTAADAGLGVAVSGSNVYVVGNTSSSPFPSTVTIGPGGGQDVFVASLDTTTGSPSGTGHYITRIGGTGTDTGEAIAVDGSGHAYIGGETDSTDFPPVSALQGSNAGAPDGFVAKLDPTGATLMFSTYLGGTGPDLVTAIALDSSSNVYVGGITSSTDLHTSSGVLQTTPKGGGDSFVGEIKSDGSAVQYLTYIGGTGGDQVLGIAVDSAGEAYVTGNTNSTDFPTANAVQSSNKGGDDVFLAKLNSTGTAVIFSTYYGGALDEIGTAIALDPLGDAFVTGRTTSSDYPVSGSPFQQSLNGSADAFLTEFSNTGSVVYSSFLGGTGVENSLGGNIANGAIGAVAVDASSNAYIAGATASTTGFPVTSPLSCCGSYAGGFTDGFVAKVGAAPADFSVAVSPTSASVTSGQTTSAITVTVSSVNATFGQSVSLSCGGLPTKAVCHFSPASVTPGTSPQTSSLTIATNGASSADLLWPSANHRTGIFAAFFLPVFGITLLGLNFTPRRKRVFGFPLLCILLAGLLFLPACGGSSNNGGGGGGGSGTPPGTYNITVGGSAGNTSHSAAFSLKVN